MKTYLDWNEALGEHFFNTQKMGEAVYLHIDRITIETIGIEKLGLAMDTAWHSFIRCIKKGFSKPNEIFLLLDRAKEAQQQSALWAESRRTPVINGKKLVYPPYLAYLVLTVLPITEGENSEILTRRDAYNPYLTQFLQRNRLGNNPNQNENNNWNDLWQALADWSLREQNGRLGIFKNPEYKNQHWKYVGKPLTQCLVPPKTLSQTRQLFDKWMLTPTDKLTRSEWRKQLAQSNGALSSDLKKILSEPDNELGNAALDQIIAEHNRWTGATEAETGQKVRIHTFLKLLDGRKSVNFDYRLQTDLAYPEDLTFNNKICYDAVKGWSNPLSLDNQLFETLNLCDEANHWEARMRPKTVRFFLNAERYGIGGGRWAEVDAGDLYVGATALALVKMPTNGKNNNPNTELETSLLFFSEKENGCERQTVLNYDGLPPNWQLIRFEKLNEKFIGLRKCCPPDLTGDILRGGLRLGYRKFLDIILPEVILKNAIGTEIVCLKKINGDLIGLKPKEGFGNIWLLPENIPRNEPFSIVVNGVESLSFELKNHQKTSIIDTPTPLPKRDKFGNVKELATDSSVIGINAAQRADRLISSYGNYFFPGAKPHFEPLHEKISIPIVTNDDWLLYFLSQKQELTTEQFFEAFENILSATTLLNERDDQKANLTWLKRRSLSLYEALGFVDISTPEDKIRILPPQLILIPTTSGFSCVLIGARTHNLIKRLFTEGSRLGITVKLENQAYENQEFLLPQRLIIQVQNSRDLPKIKELAMACALRFDYDTSNYPPVRFPQMDLLSASDTLDNLLDNLVLVKSFDTNNNFPCRIFNIETCRFEAVENGDFDKTFQLALYKFNEYTYRSVLWRNGDVFEIDKNWGRLAMLYHHKKNIVYFDTADISSEKGLKQRKDCAILALPTSVTLPRYFMQSLALCSGFAPTIRRQNLNGQDTTWYFFDNIPKLLIEQEFKKLGQQLIETQINPLEYA